jgi:hypothetical protein
MDNTINFSRRTIARAAALVALTMLFAPLAGAREVYLCRSSDGARSYQDVPCATGVPESHTLTLRDVPADEARRQALRAEQSASEYAAQERRRIAALEAAAKAKLPQSLGGSGDVPVAARYPRKPAKSEPKAKPPPGEAACNAAKSKRELAYRQHGKRMNFDAGTRLLEAVIDRCGLERST